MRNERSQRLITTGFWILFTLILSLSSTYAEVSGPKLELLESEFDFGVISQGDKVAHEFNFKNTGSSDLIISRIVPSCGCTASSLSADNIKPGEQGTIKVEFDSSGFNGAKIKTVRIFTNDPSDPTALVTFKADVQSEIIVSPERLFFGDVTKNTEQSRQLTISVRPGSKATIENVSSFSPAVSLDFLERNSNLYKVKVTLKPQTELGEIRTRIVVHVKSKVAQAINIPVFAAIKREVVAKPSTLSFGLIEQFGLAKSKIPISKLVNLESRDGQPTEILELVSSSDSLQASIVRAAKKGQSDSILVNLFPERLKTDLKASIEIKTAGGDQDPLVLNVYAVLAPQV
jgi:hypothetical protein